MIEHSKGFYSDNYSHDPSYTLIVTRSRDATDDEQADIIQSIDDRKAKDKFERYEYFLQLKGEFDGHTQPDEPVWSVEEIQHRKMNNRNRKT